MATVNTTANRLRQEVMNQLQKELVTYLDLRSKVKYEALCLEGEAKAFRHQHNDYEAAADKSRKALDKWEQHLQCDKRIKVLRANLEKVRMDVEGKSLPPLDITVLSDKAVTLLARVRAGKFYYPYDKKLPKAMKELEDAGLVIQSGRVTQIRLCYVPADGYTPFVPEEY